MNAELERIWKEVVMAYVRYYSGTLSGRIEENYENFMSWPKFELSPPITSSEHYCHASLLKKTMKVCKLS
jgi:hypothetical protein